MTMQAVRRGVLTIPWILLSFCGGLLSQAARAQSGANPCSAAQCSTLLKGGFQCGTAAPYACVTTGGCYPDSTSAQAGCANNWCYFGPCAAPASNRATRTITFVNNCKEAFAVYQDSTQIIPASSFASGSTQTRQVTLTAATNGWGATYYQSGTGIAFRAFPKDEDLSNSTLFEINFGAYSGSSDVYDLSAIPPSSCAGHMQTTDNGLLEGHGGRAGPDRRRLQEHHLQRRRDRGQADLRQHVRHLRGRLPLALRRRLRHGDLQRGAGL